MPRQGYPSTNKIPKNASKVCEVIIQLNIHSLKMIIDRDFKKFFDFNALEFEELTVSDPMTIKLSNQVESKIEASCCCDYKIGMMAFKIAVDFKVSNMNDNGKSFFIEMDTKGIEASESPDPPKKAEYKFYYDFNIINEESSNLSAYYECVKIHNLSVWQKIIPMMFIYTKIISFLGILLNKIKYEALHPKIYLSPTGAEKNAQTIDEQINTVVINDEIVLINKSEIYTNSNETNNKNIISGVNLTESIKNENDRDKSDIVNNDLSNSSFQADSKFAWIWSIIFTYTYLASSMNVRRICKIHFLFLMFLIFVILKS